MQLDRLKQTQFMAFQIGLITLSFLKLLKVPERGWFQKWFQPFFFLQRSESSTDLSLLAFGKMRNVVHKE